MLPVGRASPQDKTLKTRLKNLTALPMAARAQVLASEAEHPERPNVAGAHHCPMPCALRRCWRATRARARRAA
jgi:hypothetical protein